MNKKRVMKHLMAIWGMSIAFLSISINTFAYTVEIGGIYYTLDINAKKAEVAQNVLYRSYSGSIIIPSSFSYDGDSYAVISIGNSAFSNCSSLTSITIPTSVTSIGVYAFSGCSGLTSITIPNSVTTIEDYTFYNCSSLTSIAFPTSVTSIGKGAFRECSSLTSITIPSSVTSIGSSAFEYCSGLTSIIIPSRVTFIGKFAFYGCTLLSVVKSYSEDPFNLNNSEHVFENLLSAKLEVPKGSKSKYQFYGWAKYFNEIVELQATYSLSITAKGNGFVSFNSKTVRNKTSEFTVNEGKSATIILYPDAGYMIKRVKIGTTDVTSSVSNNQYYVGDIAADTSVEVEFEAIQSVITTYTLTIKASGNGSASYNNTTVRNKTSEFTVNEGISATISFTPDAGYKIKSVKIGSSDVTSKVSNNEYTISNISADTMVEVVFEAITHNLSIKATGNGSALYSSTTIRNTTETFTVDEGTSATITFSPDEGYRIKSVKVGTTDVMSSVSNNQYIISNITADTTVEVEFEAIPVVISTYILTIRATGNGSASYNNTTVRNTTETFTVNEGTSTTITFTPDEGYRIKSVKIGTTDVTSSVSNNQYTISNIASDTTVEVVFEAKTYTLSITASGNGYATFDNTKIRNTTKTFTLSHGNTQTIPFTPDTGYRIKSLKVNGSIVYVSNNQFTVSNINVDTTVEVEFEAIPATTYTLTITTMGNGSASYDGTAIREQTKSFAVEEGANVTITLSPDDGYRVNIRNINGNHSSHLYENTLTFSDIRNDLTVEIEFLAIPTYTLSITASGNGSALYNNSTIRNRTSSFTVNEGTSATITFTPDDGCQIKVVKVNDSTVSISNDQYTISSISKNTTVEVEFVEKISGFESGGTNYSVASEADKTVHVAAGNYGIVLEVPAMVSYREENWTVTGIDNGALSANTELAAIIWNPDAAFTENVDNPNLLLYVKSASYAPATIRNVVVNGTANSIVLSDASGKNNFYCPQEFTARTISYTHNYKMETGLGSARGWETIALPFDVQKISHQGKGEIVPFANWKSGDANKPFWLMTYGNNGWTEANSIKANTPYIISMPNHSYYKPEFRLSGNVTFSAENVTIPTSEEIHTINYNGRTFVPNYMNQSEKNCYALNVNNDYVTYSGNDVEGSKFFIGLRAVHPFEAYMISASQARMYISIDDDMTTGIGDITEIMADEKTVRVYNLNGQLIMAEGNKRLDEIKPLLSAGVYIVNGKKIIIK